VGNEIGSRRFDSFDSEEFAVKTSRLLDQLLDLIARNLGDADNGQNVPFRSQLEKPRDEVVQSDGISISSSTAQALLNLCAARFNHFHSKRLQRDECYAETVNFLNETVINLDRDSKDFYDRWSGTQIPLGEPEWGLLRTALARNRERDHARYVEIQERIAIVQQKVEEARTEALLDAVTRIANRKNFDSILPRWTQAHKESQEPFTAALLEIDDFKKISDGMGRPAANQVLAFVALELGKNIRASDFLARYDNNKFVILSAGMELHEAEKRFSGILSRLEATQIRCEGDGGEGRIASFSAKCGVAAYAVGEEAKELMHRAHDALRDAKQSGKGRVATRLRFFQVIDAKRKRKPVA
jgi:diguanylate cyclase